MDLRICNCSILAIQVFSGGFGGSDSKEINPSEFFEFMRQGDVSELLIINKTEARVFLTKEALEKEVHKKAKPSNILPTVSKQPNYVFQFGNDEIFENKINEINEADNDVFVPVNYDTESDVIGGLIFSILPFVLIIAVWIFIMRRMSSGGSGGGAGGQIFNIGKSKAKLFDEKTDT